MNFAKNIRKFRKNMHAISPVIATLLMIAIAVVASLVTYAWVMGYMNFQTEKTGKSILIQSVTYDGNAGATDDKDTFTVYLQNVGDSDVQLISTTSVKSTIYIEGTAGTVGTMMVGTTPVTAALGSEQTATIKLTSSSALPTGVQSITIKVTTIDGTQTEITKQFTIKGLT